MKITLRIRINSSGQQQFINGKWEDATIRPSDRLAEKTRISQAKRAIRKAQIAEVA